MRLCESTGGQRPGATLRPKVRVPDPKQPAQLLVVPRRTAGSAQPEARAREEMPEPASSSIPSQPRTRRRGQPRRRRVGLVKVQASSRKRAACGTNGEEGADPGDRVRLPTRRKPSKGQALAGTLYRSEVSARSPRTVQPKPSEPHVRRRDATGPRPRCGGSRRSGPRATGAERERWAPSQRPNPSTAMRLGGVDTTGTDRRRGDRQAHGSQVTGVKALHPLARWRVEGELFFGCSERPFTKARRYCRGDLKPAPR